MTEVGVMVTRCSPLGQIKKKSGIELLFPRTLPGTARLRHWKAGIGLKTKDSSDHQLRIRAFFLFFVFWKLKFGERRVGFDTQGSES